MNWEDKFKQNLDELLNNYDPNQPRDQDGKWSGSGFTGGGGHSTVSKIADSLDLSTEQSKKLSDKWEKESSKLEELFNQGSPTCTYASAEFGKWFEKEGYKVTYASGDFQDSGHWWLSVNKPAKGGLATRYIIDFGDNVSSDAIKSGKITPKIIPSKEGKKAGYVVEDYLTRRRFVKEMNKQGYKVKD